MKQSRLMTLLAVMVVLIALRFASRDEVTAPAVVQALPRPVPTPPSSPAPLLIASAGDLAAGTRDAEDAPPRNAFAPRVPPAPPQPKAPPPPPAPKPFVGPPLPPPPEPLAPPPPPPLAVIGGWTDERGVSVFVSGPRGVMQGRVGDVLLSEYRIGQIAPTQVQVTHLPSNRVISLPVPTGSIPPTLTAAR